MSMTGPSQPANPDQGFPNPHAEHYEGERTPEEQAEYRQQQAVRDYTENVRSRGTAADAETQLVRDQATPEDRTFRP